MTAQTMPQFTIFDFGDALEKQRVPGGYFAIGLAIRKGGASPSIGDIKNQLPKSVSVEITKDTKDAEIAAGVTSAFKDGKWLIFHLRDGTLPLLWRDQLLRLRNSNNVFIQGKAAEDTFFADQPESMRVLVVIDEENIGNVGYSEFLNLFDLVLEV